MHRHVQLIVWSFEIIFFIFKEKEDSTIFSTEKNLFIFNKKWKCKDSSNLLKKFTKIKSLKIKNACSQLVNTKFYRVRDFSLHIQTLVKLAPNKNGLGLSSIHGKSMLETLIFITLKIHVLFFLMPLIFLLLFWTTNYLIALIKKTGDVKNQPYNPFTWSLCSEHLFHPWRKFYFILFFMMPLIFLLLF